MRTSLAVLAAAAAVLAAASVASAARGLVVVRPGAPVVGKRATISVDARSSRPLALELVSPTGTHRRVPLRRVGPGLWRASYHFTDDGQWLLRVVRAGIATSIWVQQPPAALPPFRPAPGAKGSAAVSGLFGQGTFVIP